MGCARSDRSTTHPRDSLRQAWPPASLLAPPACSPWHLVECFPSLPVAAAPALPWLTALPDLSCQLHAPLGIPLLAITCCLSFARASPAQSGAALCAVVHWLPNRSVALVWLPALSVSCPAALPPYLETLASPAFVNALTHTQKKSRQDSALARLALASWWFIFGGQGSPPPLPGSVIPTGTRPRPM